MLMNIMMASQNNHVNEEEEMLRRVIEESKQQNPDNMTYEQMLELEERNGKVSKGLDPEKIKKLRTKYFFVDRHDGEKSCGICLDEFKNCDKMKLTGVCNHDFHEKCLDKWLENEKRCPICNTDLK